MTVRLIGDATIQLEGACLIEDAEPLLRYLSTIPHATLDWRSCDAAHTAIIQLLMAARPALLGPPRGAFLREVLASLIVELEA